MKDIMKEKEKRLKKEMYLKYKRATELLNSEEYENFIKKFEKTNKRFYVNDAEKLLLSVMDETEAEMLFTKCYPVYDIFSEKFKLVSLNKYAVVNFDTFTYEDCKEIVEWLNMRMEELTVDDVVLENIVMMSIS